MKKLVLLILIIIKIYLIFNVGQTNDYFLHSYRAWTLTHFGRDEIGNVLPVLFHGPSGYQLPLTSYLFVPFRGIGFEFLVWFLPALLLVTAFASPNLGLIFLATPAFLWPGNYGAKLTVLILCLIIAAVKRRKYRTALVASMGVSFFILALALTAPRFPGLWRTFTSNYLGFFQSESIITTVNALRGEHGLSIFAKALHNKTYLVLIYLQNVFSALNPSFLFGFGDKLQKIPPLLIILLPFLFRRPSKLIGGLAVASLLLAGFQGVAVKESGLFLFFLALVILAGRRLPKVAIYFAVILLLPMAYFSAHFLPKSTWIDRGWGLSAVVDLAHSPVLLADDVYPDPGSYLAYRLRPAPPLLTKNIYQYRNFIRRVVNVEVVSPTDPRLQAAGPTPLVSRVPPLVNFEPVVFDPFGQPVLFRLIYAPPL